MLLEIALAIGIGTGIAVLTGTSVLTRVRRRPAVSQPQACESAFILAGGRVTDAADDIKAQFGSGVLDGASWSDLRSLFVPQFTDLPRQLPSDPFESVARDDPETRLCISKEGAVTRVALKSNPLGPAEQHRLRIENAVLRRCATAMDQAPYPMWEVNGRNTVVWTNAAYDRLCKRFGADQVLGAPLAPPPAAESPPRRDRIALTDRDGTKHWYDVTRRYTDGTWFCTADSVDALITAEEAQRNFVQTLAKTFAHLSTGLAVFDRDRRLVLFNPALLDLSRLPAEFLSSRPDLLSFFDHMREMRMMPEPKNYTTWREALHDVVTAAADDRYSETWTLPCGLTYRITGRPHPDGAIAFMIEDISAEITLTRRFRAELEMTQSIMDTLDEGIAVFNHLGVMTFCNGPYRGLWNFAEDDAFSETTVMAATRDWSAQCQATPIWSDIRDFVLHSRKRASWDATVVKKDGQRLLCRVDPAPTGATVVRFADAVAQPAPSGVTEPA